jgi:hypothetical protein
MLAYLARTYLFRFSRPRAEGRLRPDTPKGLRPADVAAVERNAGMLVIESRVVMREQAELESGT